MKGGDRGLVLILTFAVMVVLTAMALAVTFMATHGAREAGALLDDAKLLYLAEAGVERALREIREDYVTNTQTGTADLQGEDTSGSSSVANVGRIRYFEDGNATLNNNSDEAWIRTFDANYTHTRIITVLLGARASRASGGTGATIEVSYTTDGSFPEAGNTILTQALTTTLTDYSADITNDRTWTWATLTDSDFILKAERTAGNRDINLDTLYLRITYEIDTQTEPWSTGSYETYPLTLGDGTVDSVTLTGEQGKVHLGTASELLLEALMEEHGVDSSTADTLAEEIVDYRDSNPFDSIEELKQVTGMTDSIFDAIDQDVTVYSYINPYAQGPAEPRAPVNINLASREVLLAIFAPLDFSQASDRTDLVDDIIAQRASAPFTCFYSSDAAVTTDFYDFERSLSYLSNSEDDRVLGNADASALVPRSGGSEEDALTTEFSYDTSSFYVDSLAEVGDRGFRLRTVLGDLGERTFTTYSGDSIQTGYRRENYE
jgi:Tfp pilus assembly protein PilX